MRLCASHGSEPSSDHALCCVSACSAGAVKIREFVPYPFLQKKGKWESKLEKDWETSVCPDR